MGSRTANHLIEDSSRLFFKSILPKYWVCRDKHDDYGIDCEVEIFDDQGNPTGLVFWVQLKGTSSSDSKIIQNVSFKNEKIRQFNRYDIPVLIVRFSAVRNEIYCRWAKCILRVRKQFNSTNLHFLVTDKWDDKSPEEVISYLKKQILIKQGKVRFPIKTFVHRKQPDANVEVSYSNLVQIKNYFATRPSYFALTNDENESILQINIENEQLVYTFTDVAFSSLGIDPNDLPLELDDTTLKFVLLTFCTCLFELGKNDLGSEVFFSNDLFSVAKIKPEYLLNVLPYLLSGPDFKRTMLLLDKFFKEEEHEDNFSHLVVNFILAANKANFNDEQLELTENFLVECLTHATNKGNGISVGVACYNLGNHYRSIGDHQLAVVFYLKARKHNLNYKTHGYYFYELAGLLFLIGRYKFAAIFYQKAWDLDREHFMSKALLADCLFCDGQYEKGLEKLDEYLTENYDKLEAIDEWHLKFAIFQTLLGNGYPKYQKRNPEQADIFAANGELDKALDEDLLCPLAWFIQGVENGKSDNQVKAFLSFTMAAIICNKDITSWVNSTLLCLNLEIDRLLLIHIIRTAYFYNKQEYVNEVYKRINIGQSDQRDIIMELIDKAIPKPSEKPVIVRFIDPDGGFEGSILNK